MDTAADSPSLSFDLLAQRSEAARVRIVIGVLLALAVLASLRRVTGGLVMNSPVFWWQLGLILFGLAYEVWVLVMTTRANTAGRLIGEFRWRANAVIETTIAIGLLLISHLFSPRGEVAALSAPPLLVLPLLTLLSILRLRPGFAFWTGFFGAAAHAALAVHTYMTEADTTRLPVYLSYAVLLTITAAAGSLVARRVRGYVEFAVREESERKRVQVLARNTLIFGLAKLAEYRDTDTGAHLERISVYCALLAREMSKQHSFIDDEWIQTLTVASSMHDIGKVGIPDAVLCKPGRLTEDERGVIQRHPGLGHRVLEQVLARNGGADALLEMSAQIAACHHERWDGAGYPQKLAADAIPLPARIVAVADVYDALTSARVYKPALTHAEASKVINEGSGTQFDPAVVAAFRTASVAFDDARRKMAEVSSAPSVRDTRTTDDTVSQSAPA
jgi:HD-GYP domain-containing protein (c-di-GMP phosphodiesterase class II)